MKEFLKVSTLGVIVFLLTGCVFAGSTPTPTTDVGSIVTAAAATAFFRLTEASAMNSPTPTITPTETPAPLPTEVILPTSIPTIVPITGEINSNVNVRGIPQKSKTQDIGGLLQGQMVKVIGRNDAADWLYILYADSPSGTGWVLSKAVTLNADMGILPILIYPNGFDSDFIMLPPFTYSITGTPAPPSTPPADWSKYGTLTQPANVRLGPSVGFSSIGILSPGQQITFRGSTVAKDWVQIDYPSGPDGHGWILASLVQPNDGFGGLTLYNLLGTPITPTPEGQAATQAAKAKSTSAADNQNNATSDTETPVPQPTKSAGVEAYVTNQINVRSGPAQNYQSMGMLNPKDQVVITGVTMNNYWYQIQFSSSPDGVGWVATQYLHVVGDVTKIPYFTNEGTPVP